MLLSDKVRPPASYPTYPPYHEGKYLEEYFFEFYQKNIDRFDKLDRKFIPIFWTNCYVNGVQDGWGSRIDMNSMQREINTLDPNEQYFIVCQHDDAPMNPIPSNTVIFSAGGNKTGNNVIPIPLICGPLPEQEEKTKTHLASFVGSETHGIRNSLIKEMKDKPNIHIVKKGWEQEVKNDQFTDFVDSSLKSKYVLCPRGYGPTSFRLYEAMQLNAVPVYISDRFWLPWQHELNWNDFCVIITEDNISNLDSILKSIDDATYSSMRNKIKEVYKNYFTLEGTCNKILEFLEIIEEKRDTL